MVEILADKFDLVQMVCLTFVAFCCDASYFKNNFFPSFKKRISPHQVRWKENGKIQLFEHLYV